METEVGMTRVWCGDRDIRGIYPLPWGVRGIEGQGWAEAGLLVTFLLLQLPQSRVPPEQPVWWLAAGGGPRWPEDIASTGLQQPLPPSNAYHQAPDQKNAPHPPTSRPAENVAANHH